jgi:hypothetical protein
MDLRNFLYALCDHSGLERRDVVPFISELRAESLSSCIKDSPDRAKFELRVKRLLGSSVGAHAQVCQKTKAERSLNIFFHSGKLRSG